jgi:hypothetical protein
MGSNQRHVAAIGMTTHHAGVCAEPGIAGPNATGRDRMVAGSSIPYTKFRDAVIAHLTIAESFGPLLGKVLRDLRPQSH